MDLFADSLEAALQKGQVFCVRDARGMKVRVMEGSVWLTQERDMQDHVIRPGGSFSIDREGVVVLSAPEGARVNLVYCRMPARAFRYAASC